MEENKFKFVLLYLSNGLWTEEETNDLGSCYQKIKEIKTNKRILAISIIEIEKDKIFLYKGPEKTLQELKEGIISEMIEFYQEKKSRRNYFWSVCDFRNISK